MSEQHLTNEVADHNDGSLAFVDTVNGGLSKQGKVRAGMLTKRDCVTERNRMCVSGMLAAFATLWEGGTGLNACLAYAVVIWPLRPGLLTTALSYEQVLATVESSTHTIQHTTLPFAPACYVCLCIHGSRRCFSH